MEADWYVDPLGRYEGRYFDGHDWTDQVKEDGRLAVDPDWNRPAPAVAAAEPEAAASAVQVAPQAELAETAEVKPAEPVVQAEPVFQPEPIFQPAPIVRADEIVDAEIVEARSLVGASPIAESKDLDRVDAQIVAPDFDETSPKAVESVTNGAFGAAVSSTATETDFTSESPTRRVAVLPDESTTVAGAMDLGGERRSTRWMYVLGALALAVALAIVLLPRLFGGGDDIADPVDTGGEAVADVAPDDQAPPTGDEAAPVEGDDGEALLPPTEGDDGSDAAVEGENDNAENDTAEDSTASNDTRELAGPDSIAVGGLEVLNGKPSLTDLTAWHRSSLGATAASLPDDAACWFGRLGDAVVQNAHCGPVAASTPSEVHFDLIPLKFEDVSEGVIQVRALTDAVIRDAVLPNGLLLVGVDGELSPSAFETEPAPEEVEPVDEEPAGEEPGEGPDDGESQRGVRGERAEDE